MANEIIKGMGFHHIALKALDFDAALKFYTEGLGMKFYTSWGEGEKKIAMLDLGDLIVITDLQGREFVYKVDSILRRDDLTFDKLREGEYPLTIFTSDGSSGRSVVVHCGLPE